MTSSPVLNQTNIQERVHLMMPKVHVNYDQPLGAGNERRVLDHPTRPKRAIKVFNDRRPEMKELTARGWAIRNLPSVRSRRQRRELECFLDLHLSGKTDDPDLPIARILGFRSTNHGPAIEVEKICRSQRNPAAGRTLRWLLEHPEQRKELPEALNNLIDRLNDFGIFVCDANARNIMLSDVGDQSMLVMVDGFGDYRTIRFWPHSKWMIRRSIRRSFQTQAVAWNLPWDRQRGKFAMLKTSVSVPE